MAARSTANGAAVRNAARRWMGTPYRLGSEGPRYLDCSGLVRRAYDGALGVWVPDDPNAIWRQGYNAAGLQRRGAPWLGDILCWSENGNGITHVRICDHYGYTIHASSYFGEVVRSERRYIPGYVGPWCSDERLLLRRLRGEGDRPRHHLVKPQVYRTDIFLRVRFKDAREVEKGGPGYEEALAEVNAMFPAGSLVELTNDRIR